MRRVGQQLELLLYHKYEDVNGGKIFYCYSLLTTKIATEFIPWLGQVINRRFFFKFNNEQRKKDVSTIQQS